jgi:hypothetical protein
MAYLEAWRGAGPEAIPMSADKITIGKAPSNDLAIAGDAMVSRLHAVLERFSAGWSVRDLGSRNGTYVNGERILSERALRAGDEIRIGKTRLIFKPEPLEFDSATATQTAEPAPDLTRREREVLTELCRPVLSGDVFTEPASVKDIAGRLVVTDAAVKQHLLNLYDKFGIDEGGERRRVLLANEAIKRGAVSLSELRPEN